MTTMPAEDRDLAIELHQVLSDIDPVRWRREMAAALKSRVDALLPKLRTRHEALAATLEKELPAEDTRSSWLAFKRHMQPRYMEFARSLQAASIHVPSLRPTNWSRSLLHMSSGLFGIFCVEVLPRWLMLSVAGAWAVFCWSCEISRRFSPAINRVLMKVFAPVAHEHETYKVNSATWYATALILLALSGQPLWCIAGLTVLGFADPVAGLVGRRFGRTRLLHNRTLEGSAAFVVAGTLVTGVAFMVLHAVSPGVAFGMAFAAALFGAVAELVSLRVDDNFSIPLAAAGGAAFGQWALAIILSA